MDRYYSHRSMEDEEERGLEDVMKTSQKRKLEDKSEDCSREDRYPLHHAIQDLDEQRIRNCLLTTEDWNLQNEDGNTVLHILLMIPQTSSGYLPSLKKKLWINSVRTLLLARSDLNIQNNDGNTVLHLLSLYPSFESWSNLPMVEVKFWLQCVKEIYIILLRGSCNVNLQNKDGNTALHLLAMYPSYKSWGEMSFFAMQLLLDSVRDCFAIVLENWADVNAQNNEGNTILHLLSMYPTYGSWRNVVLVATHLLFKSIKDVYRLLLKATIDVNLQNNDGNTALHLLSIYHSNGPWGNLHLLYIGEFLGSIREVFNFFLKTSIDVNLKNTEGNTALHLLCMHSSTDSCTQFSFVETQFWLMHIQLICDILLRATVDTTIQNNTGQTPLHLAIHYRLGSDIILKLTNASVVSTQDQDGRTPLHLAIQNRLGSDIIRKLLPISSVVNIQDKDGNTALHLLSMYPSYEVWENFPLIEILYWLISVGDICKYFLRNPVDVNAQNSDGNTALHLLSVDLSYAACRKLPLLATEILLESIKKSRECLLRVSADVNLQNKDGNTPLHLLFMYPSHETWKNTSLVEMELRLERVKHACEHLLNLSVPLDVNLKNNHGNTALHLLCMHLYCESLRHLSSVKVTLWLQRVKNICDVLLTAPIDVSVKNNDGWTPIHLAIQNRLGSNIILELLTKTSADNIQDTDGITPLHLSQLQKNQTLVEIVLKPSADDTTQNKVTHSWRIQTVEGFVTFLLKVIIWRGKYTYIPFILDYFTGYIKETNIRAILKYSISLDLLRERLEYVTGDTIEPDTLSDDTEHFIKSCLDCSAIMKQTDHPEMYASSLFKDAVAAKDIRGIQVCLRAVLDIKRDATVDCLKEAVRSTGGFAVVKAITDILVLTRNEIDTVIKSFVDASTDSGFETQFSELYNPTLPQLLSDLDRKCSVLDAFTKENHDVLIDAYCGVKEFNGEPTIVAIFKIPPFKELPSKYRGFDLEYRHAFSSYRESIQAEYGNSSDGGHPGSLLTCMPIISKHGDYLMKNHHNLNIVRGSAVRSRQTSGRVDRQTCILFSCYVKGVIPDGDIAFPRTLDGIPTDVREGVFYLYAGMGNAQTNSNTLKMGSRISKTGDCHGTLGGFVKDGNNDDLCFITCAHVLNDVSMCKDGETKYYSDIFDVLEGHNFGQFTKCGVHKRSVMDRKSSVSVDASLVKVCDHKKPKEGLFSFQWPQNLKNAAFKELPTFNNGEWTKLDHTVMHKIVVTFGAESGIRRGYLTPSGAVAKIQNHTFPRPNQNPLIFKGQCEIQPLGAQQFAVFGDSGALVFTTEPTADPARPTLKCVGMVVGGTSDFIVFMTPIEDVIKALQLKDDCLEVFKMETDMDID